MKKCRKCGIEKPFNEDHFTKNKNYLSGLENTCIDCSIAHRKQYYQSRKNWYQQYYQDNKDIYSQRTQDNREIKVEYDEQYRKDNPNYYNDYAKEYYKKNKEHKLNYGKQYREDNPEVYRLHTQKRNTMKDELPNTLTDKGWNIILQDFNYSCAYCGMTENEHLDKWGEVLHQEHFIPLSSDGGYKAGNIIPSCRSCNSSKRSQDFFEWYPNYELYNEDRMEFIITYLDIETYLMNKSC